MKHTRARLLAAGLLLVALPVYGQTPSSGWTLLPNAPARDGVNRHEDVVFVSPSTGWIVNLSGEIYKTTDGGDTWTRQLVAQTRDGEPVLFRSVAFANEQIGWVGSLTDGSDILYETRDGGQTWQDITSRLGDVEGLGLCGLWAASEQVIYGVGRYTSPARLFKSTDGGQTWTVRDMSPIAETLVDVFFFDEQHGFIIGADNPNLVFAHALVLETRDGGQTWTVRHRSSGLGEWGWKISFPTPQTGYVSIEKFSGAKFLKTTDGGQSWSEFVIRGSSPLQGIAFVTENTGWASGRGVTSVTTDGGQTWARETSALDGNINRFFMVNDSLGYAVGAHVHKFTGPVVTAREAPEAPAAAFRLEANYPNPFDASTVITYTLRQRAYVRLSIYDVLGRRVATLVDAHQPGGAHQVLWDGTTETGEAVRPGFYFYRLESGPHTQTRPMVRTKSSGQD